MKIGIVGATGLVGSEIHELLKSNKRYDQILLSASKETASKEKNILTVKELLEFSPEVVIFSAGSEISLKFAPIFASKGIKVIDNSSAWRMKKDIKLIVPEVNAEKLTKEDFIIANPNCSTVQLVMVLYPLLLNFGLKRVIVSTYQSVSGSGKIALKQLEQELNKKETIKHYPHKIHNNVIPHIDVFLENGYTKEEIKITEETKKILSKQDLLISTTAVRIPITHCHSESVMIELEQKTETQNIIDVLESFEGVVVQNNNNENAYPMPINSSGKDDVFVGRIRKDLDVSNSFHLWIVSDNLRKGAATNAVQISDYLFDKGFLD
tara:strand:- start:10 stop:978 length:969 start_codon:yes stop_codon:yes gene_type:complete